MIINYYGHSCFKIEAKPGGRGSAERMNIYIDPFDSGVGLRAPSGKADLVLVSHDHHDHNNIKALKGDFFLITNPGEYTYRGVSVWGYRTFHDASSGSERGINTVYILETEDIRICHLGDLGHIMDKGMIENLGEVDILMVPVGGKYTLNVKDAAAMIKSIEPSIVIPTHYKLPNTKIDIDPVQEFYKEIGQQPTEVVSKIVLKKNQLREGEMKLVEMSIGSAT